MRTHIHEALPTYLRFSEPLRDTGDFPGGPVAKISPPSAGGGGSVPGRGAKIPDASVRRKKKKNITQKHYCNKLKTLKMVHVKNLKKKKIALHGSLTLDILHRVAASSRSL